ncbi:MAG: PKD domain-containing protein [Salibacteraceae bacterium]
MKINLTYLVGVLVLLSSCEREMPSSGVSDAVFYINGEIGEEKVDIRAGDQNYYMFPGVSNDSLDIRIFSGVFRKLNCSDLEFCPNSIEISIREKAKGAQGRPTMDQNLELKDYLYRGPADFFFSSYKATFISKSTPINADHYWEFGDGSNSLEVNPVHIYINESDSIVNPTLYVSALGCGNSITYQTRFSSACDVDFFPKYQNGNLSWSSSPKSGRNELWDLTHGYLPLNDPNNFLPNDSIFTACVESTDTLSGCVSYKCKNIVLDTAAVSCVANYDIIKETIVGKDVKDYSEVTIKWIDSSGKLYTSEKFVQPVGKGFTILNVEEYISDDLGNPTKKLEVRINVRLFGNDESDYVDFVSDKSVFAISYL